MRVFALTPGWIETYYILSITILANLHLALCVVGIEFILHKAAISFN